MLKNIHTWLPGYIKDSLLKKRLSKQSRPIHIMFSIVDHFEPKWGNVEYEKECKRIDKWVNGFTKIISTQKDSDGKKPRYTFFYPQEEYEAKHLEKLALLCRQGFAEVEIHLHHDNDTAEGLQQKIEDFKEKLSGHNLLSKDKKGNIRYGFIHGNWALDNSRGDGRWCGVNNELQILSETGCYADFTLPSAPSDTQTSKINSIYYAKDDLDKPKSHNTGIDVEAGKKPSGDLMIVQGPLALNFKRRKFGVLPKIENSGISLNNPPAKDRVDLWVNRNISVKGKPEWIFIKVYTHGLQDNNLKDEYFSKLKSMFDYFESEYNDCKKFKLHYVTAREMYNIVKAAEAGEAGNPNKYRDYILKSNIIKD